MTRRVASGKKPELPEPQFPQPQDGVTTAAGLQGRREGQTGLRATPGPGLPAWTPAFLLPWELEHLHTWPRHWPLLPQGRSQARAVPAAPALCGFPRSPGRRVTPSHPGCPAQPGFHSLSTSPFNSSAGLSSPAPPAPPRPAPLLRKSHFISGAYCALIGPSNPPGSGTRRGLAAGSGRHPFKGTPDFLRGVILPPHGRSRAGPGAALATSGPRAPGRGWNGHGDRDRGWHEWPGQSPGSPDRWAELGLKSKLSEGGISVTSEGHTSRHPARAGSWEQGES